MKRILQICLASGLLLTAVFLLAGCTYNIENNTNQTEAAKQGTVVLTLENHLAELGTDVTAIQASKYQVDIFSNGQEADTFTVDVSIQSKFVSDTRTATVSKTYQAGEYTAVVYAQDSTGRNFGKGSLDFTVIAGTTVGKTAVVEYKIHTVDDFATPKSYPYSDAKYYKNNPKIEQLYLSLTNTKAQPDVKYVELHECLNFMLYDGSGTDHYTASLSQDGTVYRITNNETNSYLEIDTNKETLYFSNYDTFAHTSADEPLVTSVSKDCGTIVHRYDVSGKALSFSYGHYMTGDDSGSIYSLDITPFKKDDGTVCCYIPFNMVTDFYYAWEMYNFNGNAIVLMGTTEYYNSNLIRTQAVKEFNYLEFCFNMDMNYGLAKEHGITNGFDPWLKNLDDGSVYNSLMSDDITDLNEAYYQIVYKYFGDIHSSYYDCSFYQTSPLPSRQDIMNSHPEYFSTSLYNYLETKQKIEDARLTKGVYFPSSQGAYTDYQGLQLWGYDKETNTYQQIPFQYSDNTLKLDDSVTISNYSGITLYVTFDNFKYLTNYTVNDTKQSEYTDVTRNGVIESFGLYQRFLDTRTLTKVANQLVQDFDEQAEANTTSPISNIVVDLARNSGGAVDACAYIGSWLMGQFEDAMENPVSTAKSVTTYMFDINGDGTVGTFGNPDAGDTVCNKNIFVLTAPCTFSCGNLLPCRLKAAGKCTVLGSTSGGGGCCVLSIVNVDGTCLMVSSNFKSSTEKNGTFYSIDAGVPADYQFTSWENYADRAYITKVVNSH